MLLCTFDLVCIVCVIYNEKIKALVLSWILVNNFLAEILSKNLWWKFVKKLFDQNSEFIKICYKHIKNSLTPGVAPQM
jgi:hypothetical protein